MALPLNKPWMTNLSEAVVPFLQPIYDLREGLVVGFEALARLETVLGLLQPIRFLPLLNSTEMIELFSAMLNKSIAVMNGIGPEAGPLYLTVNVNALLVLDSDFSNLVAFILANTDFPAERLVLEILEDEAIPNAADMTLAIRRLKALGVSVSLDDIGSAYASLVNIKDLPVDILKLDRSFARMLAAKPEDLQFVSSMIGLARGLGRTLVVEGAETAEIVEALRIIGVRYAQGYALARPMPGIAVRTWLTTSALPKSNGDPSSLLAVYAAHLTIVEACRVLANPPLRVTWHEDAQDPHRCRIGRYFDKHCLHDTAPGLAHKRFHCTLGLAEGTEGLWEEAAEDLRQSLLVALARSRPDVFCADRTPMARKAG